MTVLEGAAPAAVSFGQVLGGFTYNAGAVPTIANELEVSAVLLSDDVALRIESALP